MTFFPGLARLTNMFAAAKSVAAPTFAQLSGFQAAPHLFTSSSVNDMFHAWSASENQLVVKRSIPPIPIAADPVYFGQSANDSNWGLYNLGKFI